MDIERKLKTKAFNDSLNDKPTVRAKQNNGVISRRVLKARIPPIISDRLKYFITKTY